MEKLKWGRTDTGLYAEGTYKDYHIEHLSGTGVFNLNGGNDSGSLKDMVGAANADEQNIHNLYKRERLAREKANGTLNRFLEDQPCPESEFKRGDRVECSLREQIGYVLCISPSASGVPVKVTFSGAGNPRGLVFPYTADGRELSGGTIVLVKKPLLKGE